MAKFCIKKDHFEVLALSKELNLPVSVIAAKSAVWMETNKVYDRFPTSSELNVKPQINYQTQTNSQDGIIATEKTIRDLAARLSDRIGIPVKFESDRSKEYKGKIENNIAYINLAYATLDTPIHEILGHPIIRAIKNRDVKDILSGNGKMFTKDFSFEKTGKQTITGLYANLLKELEYGKGKEVLDRIKRDYVNKNQYKKEDFSIQEDEQFDINAGKRIKIFTILNSKNPYAAQTIFKNLEDAQNELEKLSSVIPYTLEEQQEEAVVELLGMLTAEKLDNVKDGKLISLLKRLLKEMKQFIRSLINQKEVEIDKLPDNMTLGDLSDLLAYSNSKLILPGYEVEYTTPDNNKFKTYQEASNHISELAKDVKDVDLDNINLKSIDAPIYITDITQIPLNITTFSEHLMGGFPETFYKENNKWMVKSLEYGKEEIYEPRPESVVASFNRQKISKPSLKLFIEKNKEYEQSKEIIEEWKKVNNIQYNPEEIYSRGQEFNSVVGAYSDFDVNLMMQNLLQHIEDNEKAGGKFAISAYTKPVDKQIGHLEGGGGKIKFKIYPKAQDILWAANTDVYSGSVWDASEKVNKDKKSELLGVSYTKYPSLNNVNTVQPNLAAIVDDLSHHHNELAISLNFSNFEIEVDEDVPYQTKKIIENVNKILQQKRNGKLVKPEINKINTIPDTFEYWQQDMNEDGGLDRFRIKVYKKYNKWFEEFFDTYGQSESVREITYNEVEDQFNEALASNSTLTRNKGIQPKITNETLKESIESVSEKIGKDVYHIQLNSGLGKYVIYGSSGVRAFDGNFDSEAEAEEFLNNKIGKKEYTSQALHNTKVAALKEVAKKYPRSLIRSEVRRINTSSSQELYDQFGADELPFQKLPSFKPQEVNYIFKSVDGIINNLPKIQGWEKQIKDIELLYKKIQELGIPKVQIDLLKESTGNTVEEKLLDFLSKYSFSVEINTATKNKSNVSQTFGNPYQLLNSEFPNTWYVETGTGPVDFTTEEEALNYIARNNKQENTQHYSNLSAPGDIKGKSKYEGNPDWEYQELAIQTPLIINTSKAHIEDFSKGVSNMLGWVRVWYNKKTGVVEVQELQSDLFQKGRDKKSLTKSLDDTTGYGGGPAQAQEYRESITSSDNQFLQLLNKDNNWVTFFIKSIIQDSAKKGYEKVLFPSGNTASKVEGHQTLEEFKKQKEDRIKGLEKDIYDYTYNNYRVYRKSDNISLGNTGSKQDTELFFNSNNLVQKNPSDFEIRRNDESYIIKQKNNEINQLKQELERVETEGFGALKPIYNFYESTVTNILKKQFGKNIPQVVDEYGNTWNEVDINTLSNDDMIPKFSTKPLNSYNRLQQTQFKDNIKEGDVVSFRYWSETTSTQEGNKNVVITKVDEDKFYGYYADSKEPRVFKYSNIINDSVNGTISIPEIFAYKKNLAEGKKVSLDTVNGKVEGVIDEVGSDGFRIGETYTLFKDILASKEVDKIKTLVNKLKVDLEDKIKTFSKNAKTELQLKRIADLKDAYQALDGFTEVGDLVDFFKKIRSQVEITNSLMDNLSEEPSEMLHSLSFIHNYIKSFETIRELEQLLPKGTEVRKVANFLKSSLDNTLFKYREKAVPALAKWMWDYFPQTLNEELAKVGEEPWDLDRLISELQQPTTDLDMFNKFLVPVINSNDVIAGLFSKTLKAHLQKKDHLALTLQKSLVEIVNKLKEKGLNAIEVSKSFYKLVSEKDEEGNIKYYRQFIEKYDTSTFYDELKKLRKLRNEAYISFKSADKENRKSLLQEYFSAKDNLESYLKDKSNTSSSFEMGSIMNNLRKYDPTKYQKFLDMFYTKGSTTQDPNSLRLVEDKINEDGETTQEVVYYTYKKNHYTPILEKFINKDYEKLISNPLVKDYYELLKDAYDKADAKLPFHKRLNGRVPVTYKKESLLSLDGLKAYFTNFWKSNKTQDLTNYNGETYKTLTVPFTAKIEDKNASDNILFSTYMFITEAEYFKIKNDNLGAVEIIQDILNTTPKNSVSNLRKESVVKFLDQVFFNQTGETSIPSKMIDLLGASTAVSRMALSFNAVTNAIVGNVANYAEALGARNYTLEDYNKGVSMYFKLLKNDKDKLFNILNSIDAIQGSFRNNKGEPFKSNAQNVSWSNLMFAQDAGEHQIQGSVALALLLKKNITIPEDGIIDINTLPSNFIDTLHEINKSNHGVYNSFDKLYLQDQATFRLFLQFRKWVIPTFRSRYSGLFSKGKDKYRVDLESGTVEMGYYRAFWDYFINNCKDIEGLLTNWKNLSPMEKEGVIRTFKDMVMAITTTMLIFLLSGGDDGEDKGIADNFMLYQLTRLRSEIGAYIPILGAEDQERLVNEPFAAYSTFRDARKLVQMIISPLFNPLREEKDRTSWFDEYERSTSFAEKGDNKLLYRFNKINPLFNIYEGLSPEIQLENFNKVSR